MNQSSQLLQKLQTYLAGLTPQAHKMIVSNLENVQQRGEMSPIHEIIMDAMRQIMRDKIWILTGTRLLTVIFLCPLNL
jgi:hypothetical protein